MILLKIIKIILLFGKNMRGHLLGQLHSKYAGTISKKDDKSCTEQLYFYVFLH